MESSDNLLQSENEMSTKKLPSFRYVRMNEKAIPPKKFHINDSGYDLNLVELLKEEGGVKYYTTWLKVQPDPGYYFELVGRSSISKTGHMLANNIGIIDATYNGPIIVALRKIDPSAPDLILPCRLVQLIARQLIHLEAIEGDMETTQRGSGGFGSTGM
jgi:dUTP pyrophosphatase